MTIKVVRGNPTPEELAAALTVVRARAVTAAAEPSTTDRPHDAWSDPSRIATQASCGCGFGGVQDVVGDRVDLRRGLGCGEGVQVRGEVGRRPGLVGQWVRGAEGLCVASCPTLQVCVGGEVVAGGVDLVGVAADVVVQVEVWVAWGDAEAFRGLQWRAVGVSVIGECGEQLWTARAWHGDGGWC